MGYWRLSEKGRSGKPFLDGQVLTLIGQDFRRHIGLGDHGGTDYWGGEDSRFIQKITEKFVLGHCGRGSCMLKQQSR